MSIYRQLLGVMFLKHQQGSYIINIQVTSKHSNIFRIQLQYYLLTVMVNHDVNLTEVTMTMVMSMGHVCERLSR